ncbi:MAG: hypothetical protein ACTSUF_00920 [Candidatus Heimdallarchaeaceae archaeon]
MDHIAILRKANISKGDNLLGDILEGTKTIESRWYVNRISPWDKIKRNDTVYFKESGCPVTVKACVAKVIQIDNLNESIIKELIKNYGKKISPGTTSEQWSSWATKQTKKRYCILIFLRGVKKVTPFNIDKTGYGISSAWLAVGSIDKVRV